MAETATAEPVPVTETDPADLHDERDIDTEEQGTTLETQALATTSKTHEDHIDGDDGDSTALAPTKKTKKIVRKKRRPARVQADPSTLKSEPPPQTGTIFNIW